MNALPVDDACPLYRLEHSHGRIGPKRPGQGHKHHDPQQHALGEMTLGFTLDGDLDLEAKRLVSLKAVVNVLDSMQVYNFDGFHASAKRACMCYI